MKSFGTDGVRGKANSEITTELAMAIGSAAVEVLGPRIGIARDTRLSGPMLEAATVAGVLRAGGDVWLAGVLPTPGLSALVPRYKLDGGLMLTASHNPPEDNGVKALGADGRKLDGGRLEALGDAIYRVPGLGRPGKVVTLGEAVGEYVETVLSVSPGGGVAWLRDRTVVLDAGNGAASFAALQLLYRLGARVVPMGDGDGAHINVACGAVHPEALLRRVLETGADLGIALDGDGDRVALVDRKGSVYDGDLLLYLTAEGGVVVGTVMTNGGLEEHLKARGTRLIRTKVGDAHVADAMASSGARVGGEPSGHILFADGLPTSDGMVTALRAIYPDPRTLPERVAGYRPRAVAQAAVKTPPEAVTRVTATIAELEMAGARVVVRPSGTEPVVRVMVEHADEAVAKAGAERLVRGLQGR